jgi:hypothetical protein
MSHETQIDVDGIHWFSGYGPIPMSDDECDHDCPHLGLAVIAWGPSQLHYELVECTACHCRAWEAALPNSHGGIRGSHPFLKRDHVAYVLGRMRGEIPAPAWLAGGNDG